jgi:ankyrin repeat protein
MSSHSKNKENNTLLHEYAYVGNSIGIKSRLDLDLVKNAHKDIDAQNIEGYTPLHLAAYKGHVETVKTLIKYGAKIDERDNNGNTPFLLMISNGKIPKKSKNEISKLLADANIKAVGNIRTPVYSKRGIIKPRLKKHHIPTIKEHMPTIKEDETYKTKSPSHNLPSIERIIIKYPDMINDKFNGKTALHYAVETMDIEKVKDLIEHRADVTLKDKNGKTPADYIPNLYKLHTHEDSVIKIVEIQMLLEDATPPSSSKTRKKTLRILTNSLGGGKKMRRTRNTKRR